MSQSLYLMKNELGMFKIGISKNPQKRRNEIKNSSGVNVELLKAWNTEESAPSVERKLHLIFSDKRTHGEWFTDLTIEDIESNLEEYTEWKSLNKTEKPKKIKVHQLEDDVTPVCELLLEDQFMEMTKVVPENYESISELARLQSCLLVEITSMKAKRKRQKDWMHNLLANNNVVAPNIIGGGFNKIEKVYWDSFGTSPVASTPMPWFTTRTGALVAATLERDSWMTDILSRFDKAVDVINQMQP